MTQLHINVTQDDINRGTKRRSALCPVALAFKRAVADDRKKVSIGAERAFVSTPVNPNESGQWWVLPAEAQDFIATFDNDQPVEPFEFDAELEVF